MKALFSRLLPLLACGAALSLVAPARAAQPQEPPHGAAGATNAVLTAGPEIPQSVFVVPTSLKDGRNPFFPNSTQGLELPKTNAPVVVDFRDLVLNGITSPPKRTAMINGRTFEIGEEGEVRLTNGTKARIQCAEITDDAAIVIYGGQRRQLRLRSGI